VSYDIVNEVWVPNIHNASCITINTKALRTLLLGLLVFTELWSEVNSHSQWIYIFDSIGYSSSEQYSSIS